MGLFHEMDFAFDAFMVSLGLQKYWSQPVFKFVRCSNDFIMQ
jgi:hypothetical protein